MRLKMYLQVLRTPYVQQARHNWILWVLEQDGIWGHGNNLLLFLFYTHKWVRMKTEKMLNLGVRLWNPDRLWELGCKGDKSKRQRLRFLEAKFTWLCYLLGVGKGEGGVLDFWQLVAPFVDMRNTDGIPFLTCWVPGAVGCARVVWQVK